MKDVFFQKVVDLYSSTKRHIRWVLAVFAIIAVIIPTLILNNNIFTLNTAMKSSNYNLEANAQTGYQLPSYITNNVNAINDKNKAIEQKIIDCMNKKNDLYGQITGKMDTIKNLNNQVAAINDAYSRTTDPDQQASLNAQYANLQNQITAANNELSTLETQYNDHLTACRNDLSNMYNDAYQAQYNLNNDSQNMFIYDVPSM